MIRLLKDFRTVMYDNPGKKEHYELSVEKQKNDYIFMI